MDLNIPILLILRDQMSTSKLQTDPEDVARAAKDDWAK